MTIAFKNDNDVIVFPFEIIIAYARKFQQIFVAQCVWWLASMIGLEQGLSIHIDNLWKRETAAISGDYFRILHPNRARQIEMEKEVSLIPSYLMEDQRHD
jgi:hypothetical protein